MLAREPEVAKKNACTTNCARVLRIDLRTGYSETIPSAKIAFCLVIFVILSVSNVYNSLWTMEYKPRMPKINCNSSQNNNNKHGLFP